MAEALTLIAKSEDATIGEIVRDAVRLDLRARTNGDKARAENARRIAPLRSLLENDFKYAQSWMHLQTRLAEKGYRLHQGQSDINLHRLSGEHICTLSDLQLCQTDLARQFDTAFEEAISATSAPTALAG